MTHPKEKLPDYALGLLDPDEMAAVEAHLESCETCQEEVRRFDATLVGWVDALPEIKPPPLAKADLFNRIRNDQATSSATSPVGKSIAGEARTEDGFTFAKDTTDTSVKIDVETAIGTKAVPGATNTNASLEAEPTNVIRYYAPRTVRWLTAACTACLVLAGGGLFGVYRAEFTSRQLRAEQALVTRFLSAPNARTLRSLMTQTKRLARRCSAPAKHFSC